MRNPSRNIGHGLIRQSLQLVFRELFCLFRIRLPLPDLFQMSVQPVLMLFYELPDRGIGGPLRCPYQNPPVRSDLKAQALPAASYDLDFRVLVHAFVIPIPVSY